MKKVTTIAAAVAASLSLAACSQGSITNTIWSKEVLMPDGTTAQCVFFTNVNGVAVDCNFVPLGAK